MRQLTESMTRKGCFLSLSAFLLCVPLASHAADEIANALRQCGLIEDNTARLACYDGLQTEQMSALHAPATTPQTVSAVEAVATVAPVAAVEAVAPVAPAEAVAPVVDASPTIVDEKPKADAPIRATIVSCSKDALDKYYYRFENGEVWKRKDSRRMSLKDCNFSVTIMKDFFGYKMQRDGSKDRIRIAKVK